MDKLYELLYTLFLRELNNVSIGYSFNTENVKELMDVVNAIDYIENGDLSQREALRIIDNYTYKLT